MISTRDFLLFLLTVSFLVLAITFTAVNRGVGNTASVSLAPLSDNDEEVIYEMMPLEETNTLNRGEELAKMKDKVSDFLANNSLAKAITESLAPKIKEAIEENKTPDQNNEAGSESENSVVAGKILECPSYQKANPSWSPVGLTWSVEGNTRVLSRAVASGEVDIVLVLPANPVATGGKTCLTSDIVGVANDGSLIRNNEASLYQIFGAEVIIGYALDGFPINGLYRGQTDECGGKTEAGQYGYYLSSDRDGVLGCFSGQPTSL